MLRKLPAPFQCPQPVSMKIPTGSVECASHWLQLLFYCLQRKRQISAGSSGESGAALHVLCSPLHQYQPWGRLSWRNHPCTPCPSKGMRVPACSERGSFLCSYLWLCAHQTFPSPALPSHCPVHQGPSMYKHTAPGSSCPLPPPVPPQVNFVPIHSDLNPEHPPQPHSLSESPLFHAMITNLSAERAIFFFYFWFL